MYNMSDQAFLFKETWSEISKNHYNSDTPILARVKKKYDLQGVKDHVSVPLTESGGVGGLVSGYLPEAGGETGDQMEITAKDLVAVARMDRKAMKSALTDKGAWEKFTVRPVKKTVESYDTVCNILWHGDGTGRLCQTAADGYVSGGATAPILQIASTGGPTIEFFERWLIRGHQINIGNAADSTVEDGIFTITAVDVANKRVTLKRVSGSLDLSSGTNADGRYVYIQNLFKAAPMGLFGTVSATSGNIYTIPFDADVWGSLRYDAAGAPPSVSLLNYVANVHSTRIPDECFPDFILTSPELWAEFANIPELQKAIQLMPRDGKLTTEYGFGFAGLSFTTPSGKVIPIVKDKHCWKNKLYGLYSDSMYMHHLPDHGWWDEDGRVFMRVPNRPWYEGTYGGFFENVLHPTFQFEIYGMGYTA
jgi:hypothetical protein